MENINRIEELKRSETLLYSCIGYIMEIIDSYSEMVECFERLGFTQEELLYHEIRDIDTELELGLIDNDEYDELEKELQRLWQ